jgi:hypothetical protein
LARVRLDGIAETEVVMVTKEIVSINVMVKKLKFMMPVVIEIATMVAVFGVFVLICGKHNDEFSTTSEKEHEHEHEHGF